MDIFISLMKLDENQRIYSVNTNEKLDIGLQDCSDK